MNSTAVVFDHVWKKFRRGERHNSLRDLIPSIARRMLRGRRTDLSGRDEFWALKDVSFSVEPGEALGIIGPNGAGKSTTLKLLTRILRPTRGSCRLKGRVGALIEVAAGFHPDLTGMENVYLQGAIMGMRRSEIATKLDAIVDFSGVGEFIDTPVKRYSSGMNARLGFSIAANLEPDVLIIDEVLSVGDMAFQDRCVNRMHEFKRAGVAIVFVSHNLQAIASLCDRALYLKQEAVAIGPPADVLRSYVSARHSADQPGYVVSLQAVKLVNAHGAEVAVAKPGEPLALTMTYASQRPVSNLTFGFLVYRSTDRLLVYYTMIKGSALGLDTLKPGVPAAIRFEFSPHLTRGQYHVVCHVVHDSVQQMIGVLEPAALFSITEQTTHSGIADVELRAACQATDDGLAKHTTIARDVTLAPARAAY